MDSTPGPTPRVDLSTAITNTDRVLDSLPPVDVGTVPTKAAGRSTLSGIGRYLVDNPEVPIAMIGAGANTYGNYELGKMKDRELAMEEEEQARRFELDKMRALMSFVAASRPRY